MINPVEPTTSSFSSAEEITLDIIKQAAPTAITKAGSVIREIVVRPIAYLLSWVIDNIDNIRTKTSVSYLKTSTETDNEVADDVASNYFVTRNAGTYSKGVITLTLNSSSLYIAKGSVFKVGDVKVATPEAYNIALSDTSLTTSSTFIQSINYGDGTYIANIPVVATEVGAIELPVGTSVTKEFTSSVITACELTSPITGGSSTETDAEMFARIENIFTRQAIGSYYGIKRKLEDSPVTVKDLSIVAGDSYDLFRSRYNNIGINPGGYVDCYVKTSNQMCSGTINNVEFEADTSSTATNTYTATIYTTDATDIAGFISVVSVVLGGITYTNCKTEFISNDYDTNAPMEVFRLSTKQACKITITTTTTPTSLVGTVTVSYMPGIYAVQQYIDSQDTCFVGQNMLIKGAVPVFVGVTCEVASFSGATFTDSDISGLRDCIASYINNLPVGTKELNFSDIRNACGSYNSDADLRLPCIYRCARYTKSGEADTFYTNTGVLPIDDKVNTNYWPYSVCFLSTTPTDISITAI